MVTELAATRALADRRTEEADQLTRALRLACEDLIRERYAVSHSARLTPGQRAAVEFHAEAYRLRAQEGN